MLEVQDRVLDFGVEHDLIKRGAGPVAGVAIGGKGALAGPVIAAAVIIDPDKIPCGLDDHERDRLYEEIMQHAQAVGIGSATAQEIDQINIRRGLHLATRRAIDALGIEPHHILIDVENMTAEDLPCPSTMFRKGAEIVSIAAASIVARVTRVRVMRDIDEIYPGYRFGENSGYATKEHRAAIAEHGPCAIHRQTFLPVE